MQGSFTALERRARIEIRALAARVKFRSAVGAGAFESDAGRAFAPHEEHFTVSPYAIIFGERGPSRSTGFDCGFGPAVSIAAARDHYPVAAVTIFAVTHFVLHEMCKPMIGNRNNAFDVRANGKRCIMLA